MIRQSLVVVLLMTTLTSFGHAEDRDQVPKATPPRLVSIVEIKKDVVVYRDFVGWSLNPREVARQDPKGLVPATPFPGQMIPCAVEFSLKDGEVFDAGGARLDAEATKQRLVVGGTVLVSTSGKKIDPAYLRILEKKTLIFVHPMPPPGPPLPL